jgi:hypothetical protein
VLPPGLARLLTRPSRTGSELVPITIGIVECCVLRRPDPGDSVRYEDVRIEPNQLGGKQRKALISSLRPTVFNRDIPPFFVPQITEPLTERLNVRRVVSGGRQTEESDPIHPWLRTWREPSHHQRNRRMPLACGSCGHSSASPPAPGYPRPLMPLCRSCAESAPHVRAQERAISLPQGGSATGHFWEQGVPSAALARRRRCDGAALYTF